MSAWSEKWHSLPKAHKDAHCVCDVDAKQEELYRHGLLKINPAADANYVVGQLWDGPIRMCAMLFDPELLRTDPHYADMRLRTACLTLAWYACPEAGSWACK